MGIWQGIVETMGGERGLWLWFYAFLAVTLITGIATGWLRARKIQPRGFKWKRLGTEAIVAPISVLISGPIIGFSQGWLLEHDWITFNAAPAAWWRIAIEYAAYFLIGGPAPWSRSPT